MTMKNTIKGCVSCILPCGALDVVRVVHANGRVEEITGTILASEVMKAHPEHVLKTPSLPSDQGCSPRIVMVPPDAELQRGNIYFLMPVPSSTPADHDHQKTRSRKKKKKETQKSVGNLINSGNTNNVSAKVVVSDRYLSEILTEKLPTQKDRRRGRAAVWRPHLDSISETPSEI